MAERRNDAPSIRIIGHKRYILEKRNLICKIRNENTKTLFDWSTKTQNLYYPQGKEFVLETVGDISGCVFETKIISKKEAQTLMDSHPDGIVEKVYIKFFGEPEEP